NSGCVLPARSGTEELIRRAASGAGTTDRTGRGKTVFAILEFRDVSPILQWPQHELSEDTGTPLVCRRACLQQAMESAGFVLSPQTAPSHTNGCRKTKQINMTFPICRILI